MNTQTVTVRRVLPVSCDKVFDAWLHEEGMREWMRPGPVVECDVVLEPRIGGHFRIVMTSPESQTVNSGVILMLERPSKLQFTWISSRWNYEETLVTVELEPLGALCELTLTHERFPAGFSSSQLTDGWNQILGKLSGCFEPRRMVPMVPAQSANETPGNSSIFRLTYSEGGETQTFLLPEGDTLAGRSRICNLVIGDPSASRRHARFEVREGRCFVEDLNSSAGTCKNGEFTTRAELRDGDVVSLGQMQFAVHEPAPEQVALSGMHTFTNATVTVPIAGFRTSRSVGTDAREPEIDSNRLVAMLSDVSCELVRSTSVSQILDRIIALTFEMTHADRAFLMLVDEKNGELVPRVARGRDGTPAHGATISRTIAGTVFKDRVALLASDAQLDSRFDASESLPLQNIRSCMCAPLWHDSDVIGILYVDNPESSRFSVGDLNLFTTLSNYAAVAIEQARLAARLLEERRHRERLQRYHSPRVIERILEGENETGASFIAQERQISVLFADIVGFTTISEQMTPPEVAKLLNQFFEAMIDVIFEHEGTLDKFIGDAILATFGAALPQQDHAVRCVRAALDMRKALAGFNATGDQPELRMRIAINSGGALVGDIGSPRRREFTVLGDVVNTASRLESGVAQPDQIIISGATYQLVKDQIEARALGSVNLRGRSGPVDIYEV